MARTVYLYKTENAAQIAANTNWEVNLNAQPGSANRRRYAPFNALDVINNSTEDIEVRLERSSTKAFVILQGQTFVLDPKDDGILFYDIDIYNRHAANAIAANEITIVVRKVKDVNS